MKFSTPLTKARLIKRYKRFLCDVVVADEEPFTAHIADPGRLTGLAVEGATVWLSKSNDPKRKLAHSVEMIEQQGSLVGVRPALANTLAREALERGAVDQVTDIAAIRPEHRLDAKTRLDFMITHHDQSQTLIEVKSASMRRGEMAVFPDAPTVRGRKHLAELQKIAASGGRAIIMFVAQRDDVRFFEPAADIDPGYAEALSGALADGVELLAYNCQINLDGILLDRIIS